MLLFGMVLITVATVYIKIEAYQAPINGNNLMVYGEMKWTERLFFLVYIFYGLLNLLACFLLYAYNSTILMFLCASLLYIYVGIFMPSMAISKNPLLKAFIRGRFPEPIIVVVE